MWFSSNITLICIVQMYNVHTIIQSYLCLMKGHYQLFIVFAKALSCLSLVEDGGTPRDIMLHTHMLTHQTSLVMEEFLDSEVDNCSSSSFLYRKLSLLAEWLLWFCGSRRLDMSPKLPLISPSQLKNIKRVLIICYYWKKECRLNIIVTMIQYWASKPNA